MATLPDGLVAIVKSTCSTCRMVVPVLGELRERGMPLVVLSQDDPRFPPGLDADDERDLERSWRLGIETVPALLRVDDGAVVDRIEGWSRERWEAVSGCARLGDGLPALRPG